MRRRSLLAASTWLFCSWGCGSPAAPDSVTERPTPCTEGTALCAERVAIGPGLHLPVHSTHVFDASSPEVTRLVVVVHGTDRNGDDYFERVVAAARASGVENRTLIVAPTFQTSADAPRPDEPFWTSGGWKRGHLSSSDGPSPRVGSYAAIDRVLERVLERGLFPGIADVVVTGHSAGGQVAHRFAATSRIEDEHPGVRIRYVVANPSTYLYLGPERDGPNGFEVPNGASCPDYDEWHYGLEDLNSYAAAVGADSIRAQLLRRDVRLLLGDADSLSASLDTSCGAELQGRHRFDRGSVLFRYMEATFPGHGHQLSIVPGVGHSSTGMYGSARGRSALFGS